jgi:ATP-dependent Zn protease
LVKMLLEKEVVNSDELNEIMNQNTQNKWERIK